jgi:flagellar hook-length control protein FliK
MPVALSNAPTTPSASPGTSLLPVTPGNAQPANFFLLMAKQASAQPTTVQPGLPIALADPLSMELPQLESDDTDPDTDDLVDEEDALAMTAMLPGLSAPATPAPSAASKAQSDASASAISATQREAASAAAEAFVDATSDEAATADPDSAPTTQAAHAAQAHGGLTNQMAASTDAAQMAQNLRAPVGTPAWNDELGGRLTWMAANGRESASLRLSPENLGPVEVRISVEDGEAKVWFNAAHAETRNALEQSLPRLRELFASQGLVLADAGVHREAPRHSASANSFAGTPDAEMDATAGVNSVTIAHAGLIDTYV